jgi:transmembrane sensor
VNAEDIYATAAEWVVRKDRAELSVAQQAELQGWLEADPRHLGAFVRAEAAWLQLDRARALGLAPPSTGRRRKFAITLRAKVISALAASILLAVGIAFWNPGTTYETQPSEIRKVRFEDGTVVAMNGGTELHVVMSRRGRHVHLDRGEAWFQVAHDRSRPFVVDGGGGSIRAVGTAFSVTRHGTSTELRITEGVVAAKASTFGPEVPIPAGTRALLSNGFMSTETLGVETLNRELAWRDFEIALAGDTLREAVAQFNRYNVRKLEIIGPGLAEARVVGWFRLDDPDAFARAVSLTLGARVVASDNRIELVRAVSE